MMNKRLVIRFDGPPSHESGRFIEVELDGASVGYGEWEQDGEDWLLVLPNADARFAQLQNLQAEIEPYALHLEPSVVMYKATPNLPSLANWVERFLTIMRDKS